MTEEKGTDINKYNDPTLPGYNPGGASYGVATNKRNKADINKYNDPTLPGYNPGGASYGVATNKRNKADINKYNDPTLPGYNPGGASYGVATNDSQVPVSSSYSSLSPAASSVVESLAKEVAKGM